MAEIPLALVVDDDLDVCRTIADMLTRTRQFSAVFAHSQLGALRVLESRPDIDVLITDVVLGLRESGYDLAVRARAIRPNLKVVYISGYVGRSIQGLPRLLGPVLRKPVETAELLRAIDGAPAAD